jgi:PAS domain-containing protein
MVMGRDELTSLANSLNGMLGVLAEYRQHLEEMVDARTLELALKNKHLRQEVAERRQAEAELRLSEDKFARAFQLSPDGRIIIRLADSRIIDVNEGFTLCTGYAAAEVVGQSSLALDFWINPIRPASLRPRNYWPRGWWIGCKSR